MIKVVIAKVTGKAIPMRSMAGGTWDRARAAAEQAIDESTGDDATVLAHALNVAMMRDATACARYYEIHGVEWQSIPTVGGERYFDAWEGLACPETNDQPHPAIGRHTLTKRVHKQAKRA